MHFVKVNYMTYKNDIFEVLENIDKKNVDYFKSLTEEQQKQLSPFVLLQWMKNTKNDVQIVLLNEFVNPYVFDLGKHKELLFYLLTICASGKKQFYKWTKKETQKIKFPETINIIKKFFNYSTKEAQECLNVLSKYDIMEMTQKLGYQDDELKKLKKELKNL